MQSAVPGYLFMTTIRGRVFPSLVTSYILLCLSCTYLQYSFELIWFLVGSRLPRNHIC